MNAVYAAPPLAFAAVRRDSLAANAVLAVAGAVLVALCAQISIPLPFTPVPITGQTFAVLLVGASLGPLAAFASIALYLLAGVAGAPVYAHGDHGWSTVTGATGGYLVGFLVTAAVVGLLATRGWDRRFASSSGAMLAGSVIVYAIGLPWLAASLHTDLEKTLELGLYPFVVGDILKLYVAAALLPAAWRLVGRR
jgi:biotin transport system substrate-specific component